VRRGHWQDFLRKRAAYQIDAMRQADRQTSLRSIPSVDRVVRELGDCELARPVVVAIVRQELDILRDQLAKSGDEHTASDGRVIARIRQAIDDLRRSRIQPVINGTGIIIHTNFGRSPLGPAVVQTLGEIAANYTNLEFDLNTGERGGRAGYLEHHLAILCQAEAATVVNNCAAALILALRHFASKPPRLKVIISRGELVQIGGGFRIPEILESAGCVLREVGTTNKTTIDDYRRAIDDRSGMILRVHQSNFYMGGFVESPTTKELADLAHEADVPFLFDIGSGATFDTSSLGGNEREPTAAEAITDGADLVTFSGDKLLGGPQAGIVAGRREYVSVLKKDPFFRALRCDKLILAALQATVELVLVNDSWHWRLARDSDTKKHGRDARATNEFSVVGSALADAVICGTPTASAKADPTRAESPPVWGHIAGQGIQIRDMMAIPLDSLGTRARHIFSEISGLWHAVKIVDSEAQVGGGSLPRTTIPSVAISFSGPSREIEAMQRSLRLGNPPIVGYLASGEFRLDLRTIFPRQDDQVVAALREIAKTTGQD
jgi:L-seryl-tRNA(Ser) seleniumtransferase